MKFNWGHGITIFIVLFMAFIVTLVIKTFNHNADLVQDDYYEQEVLYNGKKESIHNYKNLDFELEIRQNPEGILIIFPENYSINKGHIQFYRADDKSLDKNYDLALDSDFKMTLPYSDFIVGKYEVNISWDKDKKSYLHQSEISF